jgi:hypothetical protein
MIGTFGSPGRRKYACSEWTTRSSTDAHVLRAAAAEEVHLELLEVENDQQLVEGALHRGLVARRP